MLQGQGLDEAASRLYVCLVPEGAYSEHLWLCVKVLGHEKWFL